LDEEARRDFIIETPKGKQKLSGKRTGFGQNSGEQLFAPKKQSYNGESFRLRNRGRIYFPASF